MNRSSDLLTEMARTSFTAATNAVLILLSVVVVDFFGGVLTLDVSRLDLNQTFILRNGGTNQKAAMLLPLFRSPPRHDKHSSTVDISRSRRHLQSRKPNSRMFLHDDLLINGYYSDLIEVDFYFYIACFFCAYVIEMFMMQVLYNSVMDRDAAAEICSYSGYWQYCNLCSLFYL